MENENRKRMNSEEFKKFFLLAFTKELIKSSAPYDIIELKNIVEKTDEKSPQEREKQEIKEIIQEKQKELSVISQEKKQKRLIRREHHIPAVQRKTFPFENFQNVRLTIPETRLPTRLQYIRPTPTESYIDLGELNPLLNDPFVKAIECDGPDQNIMVHGNMGAKPTAIKLSKEEIDNIIKTISDKTKIPVSEGVFKIAVGKIIFMAIVSEVIGSKFLIKKMLRPPQNPNQNPNLPPMMR